MGCVEILYPDSFLLEINEIGWEIRHLCRRSVDIFYEIVSHHARRGARPG